MKPIGIDLAGLIEGKPFRHELPPRCPGALIRVTRKDFNDFVDGGESFITERKDIPVDGYGSARVHCSQDVEQLTGTASGNRLFYGLCSSCSRLEADVRATLRERNQAKGAG